MSFSGWLIVTDVILICIAILTGSFQGNVTLLFGELQMITFLSTAQLLLIASFCALTFREIKTNTHDREAVGGSFVWLLFAIAFFVAAMDELFMIHENLDYAIHSLAGIVETAVSDRIDDFIIFFGAVLALCVLFLARRELKQFSSVRPLVVVAFVMSFSMIVLDAGTNRPDLFGDGDLRTWMAVLEDVLKIAAEAMFLIAAQRCWQTARL